MRTVLILFCLAAALSLSAGADAPGQKAIGHPRVIADLERCVEPQYLWVSKDQLLLFIGVPKYGTLKDLALLRVPNGLRQSIPGLRSAWDEYSKEEDEPHGMCIVDPIVTPNGRWMYFIRAPADPSTGMVGSQDALSLTDGRWIRADGPRPNRGGRFEPDPELPWHPSPQTMPDLAWTPDSRHFVTVYSREKPVIESYEWGNMKPLAAAELTQEMLATRKWLRARRCWVAASGEVYFLGDYGEKTFDLSVYKRYDKLELVRFEQLPVPRGDNVRSTELSVDGKLLAWSIRGSSTFEVWITELETGKNTLLVEGIKPPDDPEYGPDIRLLWRPGTTQLSYNSAGKLWVVDARPK